MELNHEVKQRTGNRFFMDRTKSKMATVVASHTSTFVLLSANSRTKFIDTTVDHNLKSPVSIFQTSYVANVGNRQ